MITMTIKGLDRIIANMSRYGSISRKWIDRAIKTSILDVEGAAVKITPIDSGKLRSMRDRSLTALRGTLRFYAPYAIYVHEGTGKWPLSQPPKNAGTVRQFLKEGAERSTEKINKNFQEAGDRIVNELA